MIFRKQNSTGKSDREFIRDNYNDDWQTFPPRATLNLSPAPSSPGLGGWNSSTNAKSKKRVPSPSKAVASNKKKPKTAAEDDIKNRMMFGSMIQNLEPIRQKPARLDTIESVEVTRPGIQRLVTEKNDTRIEIYESYEGKRIQAAPNDYSPVKKNLAKVAYQDKNEWLDEDEKSFHGQSPARSENHGRSPAGHKKMTKKVTLVGEQTPKKAIDTTVIIRNEIFDSDIEFVKGMYGQDYSKQISFGP
jgi:hypothetical protein